jgi:hypothetical protein
MIVRTNKINIKSKDLRTTGKNKSKTLWIMSSNRGVGMLCDLSHF